MGIRPGSRVDARIGNGTHLDNPAGQETACWIRVSGDKTRQFNPTVALTVSIWALGYSYPIRSYETIIAKGDTSWKLQRVAYGPGGGAQKIAGQRLPDVRYRSVRSLLLLDEIETPSEGQQRPTPTSARPHHGLQAMRDKARRRSSRMGRRA